MQEIKKRLSKRAQIEYKMNIDHLTWGLIGLLIILEINRLRRIHMTILYIFLGKPVADELVYTD